MIPYLEELYEKLSAEYSVTYYTELSGEHVLHDCFILNGFCIKLDRLDVDTLSSEDMVILLNAIHDTYKMLIKEWEALGHAT